MKKFTLKQLGLIRKITSVNLSTFYRKNKFANDAAKSAADRRLENNGERWLHVYPETGENYLGISLYQFELERAKALAVA